MDGTTVRQDEVIFIILKTVILNRSQNNQTPITKLQLITNTQYSITKQRLAGIFTVWVFGHWVFFATLVIQYSVYELRYTIYCQLAFPVLLQFHNKGMESPCILFLQLKPEPYRFCRFTGKEYKAVSQVAGVDRLVLERPFLEVSPYLFLHV